MGDMKYVLGECAMRPGVELSEQFTKRAEAVSAVVTPVASMNEVYSYLFGLSHSREPCVNLISNSLGTDFATDQAGEEEKKQKIIAAPLLPSEIREQLSSQCSEQGIVFVEKNLRAFGGGIDVGFTIADFGVAETGSLVMESSSEEVRLTTMLSELHVCLLATSKIVADSYDIEKDLVEKMKGTPNYTAFITGPSRTADIERVLALGVHGPLELHILLLEE